jgi:hypothetical protein
VRAAARWVAALAFACAAGVAMSFGQTYSPEWLSPLFNSAAPVVAVAGLVAFAARRWWTSALIGALAGPTLVAGYYATSHLRGFAGSSTSIALWSTAGVIAGAAMGLAVWVLLTPSPLPLRAAAAALWPGIAIGEAAHGIVRIADTTPAGYWWAQAAVGVAALAAIAWKHLPTWSGRLLAAAFTAAFAAALFVIYGLGG